MQSTGLIIIVLAVAIGMVGKLVGYLDARRGPEEVPGLLVTLGPLRAHLHRRGILIHFGSRGSVAVERGLLIMLLGVPLAVAGAIIGLSS